jgi:hypothetical protein
MNRNDNLYRKQRDLEGFVVPDSRPLGVSGRPRRNKTPSRTRRAAKNRSPEETASPKGEPAVKTAKSGGPPEAGATGGGYGSGLEVTGVRPVKASVRGVLEKKASYNAEGYRPSGSVTKKKVSSSIDVPYILFFSESARIFSPPFLPFSLSRFLDSC